MKNFRFFALIWLLLSCTQEDEKNILRMNVNSNLNTLDPAFAKDQNGTWMTSQIFNGLIELDTLLNPIPAIAKDWKISDDGKIYKFWLRNDVFFHESPIFGEKKSRNVNAQDFVYSFERICNPKTASPGFWIFNQKVKGLEEFVNGKSEHVSGFVALNDSLFEIHLQKPFAPFLRILSMPYAFVVPKEGIEKLGKDFAFQPVGTGPFVFKKWEQGKFVILHKNPNYFEKGLPRLEAVHVRMLNSKLTAFAEFQTRKLDFINNLDPLFKEEILTKSGELKKEYQDSYFKVAPQLSTEYLAFMCDQKSVWANPNLRKSISYLIDREAIVIHVLKGIGKPAHQGFIPYGMPGFSTNVKGIQFDPKKAKEYLQKAGFQSFQSLPPLTLYTNPNYQKLAIYLQFALEKYGLKCQLELLEPATLRKEIVEGKIGFWRANWMADYPDAENFLVLFATTNFSPNGPNTTHFSTPKVDKIYQKLLSAPEKERQKLFEEMENLVLEESPMIYLFYEQTTRLIRNNLKDLYVDPMNNLRLKHAWKS